MVGFDVSERTVSPWMRRAPRDSEAAQRWRTFLHNHREAIAAVDFFAVPTARLVFVPSALRKMQLFASMRLAFAPPRKRAS
jgi:hypothetical protein